jgi:hypothetical protein
VLLSLGVGVKSMESWMEWTGVRSLAESAGSRAKSSLKILVCAESFDVLLDN